MCNLRSISIFWANRAPQGPHIYQTANPDTVSYSNMQGGWPGIGKGNIDIDPCFVDPGYWNSNGTEGDPSDDFWVDGDYHLTLSFNDSLTLYRYRGSELYCRT